MGILGGVTWSPSDIPLLTDKVILVTGGNTGLGFETIRQFAAHKPLHIFLAARNPSKGQAAVAALKRDDSAAEVTFLHLDLSSLESVAAAAQDMISKCDRLDILVNNAGIMAVPQGTTQEGYEIQFGTNHMGHALLTKLLLPKMVATTKILGSDVRIINVTSEGHNFARTGSTFFAKDGLGACGPWVRYGYSKLANILFTRELALRYPEITSTAVHPGIIATDLYDPQKSNFFMRIGLRIVGKMMGTVATGAFNQLWAATAEKDQVVSGVYYKPVGCQSKGSPCAQDAELAAQLWKWTETELQSKGY